MVTSTNAATVGELIELVNRSVKLLASADYSRMRSYALAQFVIEEGAEPAQAAIGAVVEELNKDSKVRSFEGHYREFEELGKAARKVIGGIEINSAEFRDFGAIKDYCKQGAAAKEEVAQLEQTKQALVKMQEQARSQLLALATMRQAAEGMENVYKDLFEYALAHDVFSEATSYGTGVQTWEFFTCGGLATRIPGISRGGEGSCWRERDEVATEAWRAVEDGSKAKAEQVSKLIDSRRAYYDHFYATAAAKCAESEAEKERRTAEEAVRSAADEAAERRAAAQARRRAEAARIRQESRSDCTVLDDPAESEALMQADEARWLALVEQCT
jgi:hypothetical protein